MQVFLEDLVGDLEDGLGGNFFNEAVFGLLVGVVIILHELRHHLPTRVKHELDLLGSHEDKIRNDLIIRLRVFIIIDLRELVDFTVGVLAILVTE